jgi:lactate dehydrogenase-like 2-hydroxyacid dehydrogenase
MNTPAERPVVLLLQSLVPLIESKLDDACTVHRLHRAPDRQAMLADVGPSVRGVVTGGAIGIKRDLMDALPALEIVAVHGIGTDAVDLDQARRRGIRVTTTPNVLTDDVADMAIGLLLSTSRRLCTNDRFVRAGQWLTGGVPLARKVTGKRLGLLGLGRVGRAIAHRAQAFGMAIAYTDVRQFDDVPYRYVPTLDELAGGSDILVVAASGGPQSKGIVGAAVLDALGRDGILINVARGSIVDEPALVAALTEGRLGGAGLDVFADEPRVPDQLLRMDNVVLQPHQASATLETRIAMGELVLANLAAHFAGKPLPTPVV